MRKYAVVLFLLLCSIVPAHGQKTRWAQDQVFKAKNNVDYPIKIHISGLRLHELCFGEGQCKDLVYADAIMDGKKIELTGDQELFSLFEVRLFPGDYQARLIKNAHYMEGTPINQVYELLLPDRYIWRCTVTGISE
jgi:hypothetical protein